MFTAGITRKEKEDAVTASPRGSDPERSEMTQPMEGNVSDDDDAGGWLGSISTDFRSMAMCFKDSTMPVFGGVMSLVRQTAMTVAAEIAQLEQDGDFDAGRWQNDNENVESICLPWEIQQDYKSSYDVPLYVTDLALMDLILALSMQDATFSTPFTDLEPHGDLTTGEGFTLDVSRLALIQRLLDADGNLADARTRILGGRHDTIESVFWRNYFYHCDETRKTYLKDRSSRKHQSPPESCTMLNQLSKTSSGLLGDLSDEDLAEQHDDSSLVPASVTDDSSYVLYPAPNSENSFLTTRSWGDIVLVGRDANKYDVDEY